MPFIIPYRFEDMIYLWMIPVAVIIIAFIIKKDFVKFKSDEEKKAFKREKKWDKIFMIVMRSCAVALLFVALSSPFITDEREVIGDPHVTIMVDNSTSFSMFKQSDVSQLIKSLEKYMPVKVRHIGSSDSSNIGDEIINNIQGNGESVLLITDGWITDGSTLDNAFTNAAISETTINTVNLELDESDLIVMVNGPSQNIIGLSNTFTVSVENVGAEKVYSLKVILDNETVIDKIGILGSHIEQFERVLPQGYHTIRAFVEDVDDHFSQNNAYLKTVQILPKPKVLFVSEAESPLKEILEQNYNLDTLNYIPNDLSAYYAIMLNDLPIAKINPKFNALNDYVIDGDGLIVIGGKNSYDLGDYKGTLFETLLPVRIGSGVKSGASGVNVVIVIDASYSFKGDAIDYAKALAVDILYNARLQDSIGVIAFRSGGGAGERTKTVVNLTPRVDWPLDFEDAVISHIGRIVGGGGTDIYAGLKRAEVILKGKENINLIIISDGQQVLNKVNTIRKATALAEKGYKIFTVGYSNSGLEGVDQLFMQEIAEAGDGIYTGLDQPLPMEFIFEGGMEGEEELEQKKDMVGEPLIITNPNHWITKGLGLADAAVSGYNAVVPKKSAHGLVYSITANPVISVWNFGLGRVVAYSTDDGRAWSGPILEGDSSVLIPRMVNWAIEDPDRKDRFNVDLEDTRLGKKTTVTVHADKMPELLDFVFIKTDDNEYTTEYYPVRKEFRDFFGYKQAVNCPYEYINLGMNPHFLNLVRKGAYRKGEIFKMDEIENMVEKIKEDSVMIEPLTIYMRWPFVLIALALFMIEICIRRIRDYRK
ncbi:MAG: vWA domain-containing protein [Nanoarchaeota archaeon]|nr:vWA domain-containing protein [Nanoarchaeota archaeon]